MSGRASRVVNGICQIALGFACIAAAVVLSTGPGFAQQPVLTIPQNATTQNGNVSSSIASTNVFQQVWASAPARRGCTIINYGAATMWVTEGYAAGAELAANAVQLATGQAYYCQVGGLVLTGRIAITGTATQVFYAAQY